LVAELGADWTAPVADGGLLAVLSGERLSTLAFELIKTVHTRGVVKARRVSAVVDVHLAEVSSEARRAQANSLAVDVVAAGGFVHCLTLGGAVNWPLDTAVCAAVQRRARTGVIAWVCLSGGVQTGAVAVQLVAWVGGKLARCVLLLAELTVEVGDAFACVAFRVGG